MTKIDEIVTEIRKFPGITRKSGIKDVVDTLPMKEFPYVHASAGEDAAAIEYGDDYILLAADGIMESLVTVDPYFAGYFAVLVNVNDIAAMGGRVLGLVDVLSVNDPEITKRILDGMSEGIRKFHVPVVGGHTHPDCNYHAIDMSISGTVKKSDIILSSTARGGDDIVFVMDLEGYFPKNLPYAWETTTRRSDEIARAQMEAMCTIGKMHLTHSAKDMSNPGSVGTTCMMLESSGKGGVMDIEKIPTPKGVDLVQWLLAYQGCGFTFACAPENSQKIIDIFAKVGCAGAIVGKVDNSSKVRIIYQSEERELFDFDRDIITGCNPKRADLTNIHRILITITTINKVSVVPTG